MASEPFMMNDDARLCLTNLKVLAKMKSGDVLSTRGRHFQLMPSESWLPQFMTRWWYGESRVVMIHDITTVVELACALLQARRVPDPFVDPFRCALTGAQTGLQE